VTEAKVMISNPVGLRARPAALFVQVAGKFSSKVWVSKDEKQVNGKSIMGLMSLAISQGNEVIISAEGEDEHLAVKELVKLITKGFEE
jgi:phosphocarrier protein HPr